MMLKLLLLGLAQTKDRPIPQDGNFFYMSGKQAYRAHEFEMRLGKQADGSENVIRTFGFST